MSETDEFERLTALTREVKTSFEHLQGFMHEVAKQAEELASAVATVSAGLAAEKAKLAKAAREVEDAKRRVARRAIKGSQGVTGQTEVFGRRT